MDLQVPVPSGPDRSYGTPTREVRGLRTTGRDGLPQRVPSTVRSTEGVEWDEYKGIRPTHRLSVDTTRFSEGLRLRLPDSGSSTTGGDVRETLNGGKLAVS